MRNILINNLKTKKFLGSATNYEKDKLQRSKWLLYHTRPEKTTGQDTQT